MFEDFGYFTEGEYRIDEDTGARFRDIRNEEGVDFYLDVSMKHARWTANGQFIDAIYAFYASVNKDGTVRVVASDPSAAVPMNAYFIGTDTPIEIGMVVDFENSTFQ